MKQGTVSWLFGCHSIVHSFLVLRAWHHLYGSWPRPWELTCIFLHDVGHLGKQYLDNLEEKKQHYVLGAKIARRLFGRKGYEMVAGHCEYSGLPESRLYRPDKYSWMYEPYWWARWNALVEPKLLMGFNSVREAYAWFHRQVKDNVESGEYRSTHSMFLERANGGKLDGT
jgi:hypothetical protein